MVTSQSAATAACLAIENGVTVQRVDYERLQSQLVADGQVLVWPPNDVATQARRITPAESLPGIVLDNESAEFTGE